MKEQELKDMIMVLAKKVAPELIQRVYGYKLHCELCTSIYNVDGDLYTPIPNGDFGNCYRCGTKLQLVGNTVYEYDTLSVDNING